MAEKYEDSKLYRVRHSAAHVMAQAVLEKFPEGKVAIGKAKLRLVHQSRTVFTMTLTSRAP